MLESARRFYEREGFSVSGQRVSAGSGLPTLKMLWKASGLNQTLSH